MVSLLLLTLLTKMKKKMEGTDVGLLMKKGHN